MARLTVPVSVTARHDKRLMRAGDDAELLWYRLLQLAKTLETDGVIPMPLIIKEHRKPEKALTALVTVGLVRDLGDDDYQLAGWLDWNPSKADIDRKRAADRDRKKGGNPNGSQPDPTPDSGRNRTGFQAESERSPFGEKSDSAHVKGREGKGRESNYSVGTSTVGSPAGSDPGSDPRPRPAWARSAS